MAMISLGPWGGSGGSQWSYRASSGITEIVLRVGGNIKSISFRDANGRISGTFGGEGNDRGEERRIEIQWPSEYLISVTGTYGSYEGQVVITSLSFITNLTTYGPFGEAPGEDFSIPIADSQVVGFHGSSADYLDALGIFVRPTNTHGSISVGPWGGPGGDPFSFRVPIGISEIVIHVGNNIKSISFRDASGVDSGRFGGLHPTDTGARRSVVIDWPSEYLISISGTYGNFAGLLTITTLSFTTNKATYGPFGTGSGTSFSIPISNNAVIGFHGRAGYYLDAIGIFATPKTTI